MSRSIINRSHSDETVNPDRWLVSYSDLLTLLLAFFVVMYSIEQMDDKKAAAVVQKLSESFASPDSYPRSPAITVIDLGGAAGDSSPGDNVSKQTHDNSLERLGDTIQQAFSGDNSLEIRGNEEWLEISLDSSVLFESGAATLVADSIMMLKQIANIMMDHTMPIRVEGFTDNQVIQSNIYPSNWELSSARASSVVKYLADNGVTPNLLSATGYAQYQPISDNDSVEGRIKNRRVVLLISKSGSVRPVRLQEDTKLFDDVDTSAKAFVKGLGRTDADREAQANALARQRALEQGDPLLIVPKSLQIVEPAELSGPPPPPFNTIQLNNGGILFTNDDQPDAAEQ